MFGWLRDLFGISRQMQEPFSELGALGTHSRVVTNWLPGPISAPRLVNMGDGPREPLRRTRTVRGPLVLSTDQKIIPIFQGEKVPPPAIAADVTEQNTAIEEFATAMSQGGFPA